MKNIIFLYITLFPFLCYSQEENKEVRQQNRMCRAIYLERPRGALNEVYLFDGAKSRKITLTSTNFSERFVLPSGELSLALTAKSILDSTDLPEGAPKLTIPAEVGDFYLIVEEDLDNKILPIKMSFIDDGGKKLKLGQTLWVNFTAHEIAGKLGDKKLLILPNSKIVSEAPMEASGYFLATFSYRPNSIGDLMPLMRKSWWFDAKSKNIGFIVDAKQRLPRIYSFRDKHFIKPKKGKAKEVEKP